MIKTKLLCLALIVSFIMLTDITTVEMQPYYNGGGYRPNFNNRPNYRPNYRPYGNYGYGYGRRPNYGRPNYRPNRPSYTPYNG